MICSSSPSLEKELLGWGVDFHQEFLFVWGIPGPHIIQQQGEENELHLFLHKLPLNLSAGFQNVNEKTIWSYLMFLKPPLLPSFVSVILQKVSPWALGCSVTPDFHTFLQKMSYRSKEHLFLWFLQGRICPQVTTTALLSCSTQPLVLQKGSEIPAQDMSTKLYKGLRSMERRELMPKEGQAWKQHKHNMQSK